jgi:hypothetical protein
MKFRSGGMKFSTATFVDGTLLRKRIHDCLVTYRRKKTVIAAKLDGMLPVRTGTLTLR